MKKAIIIIPYFGVFPSFFQLFLDSCRNNVDYTWLIHTDIEEKYNVPDNVILKYTTFPKFIEKIQEKFEFKIQIIRPHKLCDFKVAYGYIFEDEIKDFEYWGHGDLDLIYGNLNNFLAPLIEQQYDKIYSLGHLSLYRNTAEINRVFMDEYENTYPFKTVFASDKAYAFDEWHCPLISINHLFRKRKLKFFQFNECANLASAESNFKLSNFLDNFQNYAVDSNDRNVFTVNNGVLNRHFIINNRVEVKEYPYLHFHKRNMSVKNNNLSKMLIVPNAFIELSEVTAREILLYSKKKTINTQYFKRKIINIKYRIKQLLR